MFIKLKNHLKSMPKMQKELEEKGERGHFLPGTASDRIC